MESNQDIANLQPSESDLRFNSAIKIFQGESNPQRLKEWLTGINIPPTHVEIHMTNRCNNHCDQCIGGRTDEADLTNPLKVIDELAAEGTKALLFCGGGEPLLNPYTPKAIEYAKSKNIDVGLVSNGSISFTDEKYQSILRSCSFFRVSLDAGDPNGYLYSHGMPPEAFWKTVNNIKRIATQKQQLNTTCSFGVGYLTNESTKPGMQKFVELLKDVPGIDFLQFRPFRNDDTDISSELIKCADMVTSKSLKILASTRYQNPTHPRLKCLSPYFETLIAANGKAYICSHHIGDSLYQIGDITKESFHDMWSGQARKAIIDQARQDKCPTDCKWLNLNKLLNEAQGEGWQPEDIDALAAPYQNQPNPHANFL
jgi:radical SAM protein with 4Fe4S-binding SPASM domain